MRVKVEGLSIGTTLRVVELRVDFGIDGICMFRWWRCEILEMQELPFAGGSGNRAEKYLERYKICQNSMYLIFCVLYFLMG